MYIHVVAFFWDDAIPLCHVTDHVTISMEIYTVCVWYIYMCLGELYRLYCVERCIYQITKAPVFTVG